MRCSNCPEITAYAGRISSGIWLRSPGATERLSAPIQHIICYWTHDTLVAVDLSAPGPPNHSQLVHLEVDPEVDPGGEHHLEARSPSPSEAARTGLEGQAAAVAVVVAVRTATGREDPSKAGPAAAASHEHTDQTGQAHLEAGVQEECDLAWEEASGRAEGAGAHMG